MTIRILPEDRDEVLEAAEWYERREAGLGDRSTEDVELASEAIREHPDRFPIVAEVRSRIEFRRFLLDRFPYSVIYRILPEEIVIVAIAHAKRRSGYWKRRQT